MIRLVNFPIRSLHKLSRAVFKLSVLPLLLFSIGAIGQTQQVVLGTSQILNSHDSNTIGIAEAFPVTAKSTSAVNTLSVFLDVSNTAGTVWVAIYA